MNKFHMVLGFAALTTTGGAALAHGTHGGRAWNADANHDGKVTLDESLAVAKTHFDQLLPVYIVGPIVGGLVGAFTYEFVGHHRAATVPGAAVPEAAHADA